MAGRMINDHSFWAGGKPAGSVLPDGAKMKSISSTDGFGELNKYEDTEQAIQAQQNMNKSKVKGHPMKSGYRQ